MTQQPDKARAGSLPIKIRHGEAVKACLAALLTFSLGLLLINSTHDFWDTRIQTHTRQIATDRASTLQRHVGRSLAGAQILGAYIHGQGGTTEGFEEMAHTIHHNLGGINNLQLAPGGVVRHIHPLPGQEAALGHDLLADDARNKEALAAIRTGRLTLAGPFDLVQGGVAIIGRQPIYLHDEGEAAKAHPAGPEFDPQTDIRSLQGNRFWGFASVVIYLDELVAMSGLDRLDEDYGYRLWRYHPDSGERQLISGSLKLNASLINSQPIDLPNSRWFLEVGYQGLPMQTPLLIALVLLNIALTLLSGYWIYQLLTRPRALAKLVEQRTRELDAKNRQLHREKLQLRLFKNAVKDSGNSIMITDARGVIEYVNPRFCAITGYTEEEVMRQTPAILESTRFARPEQHTELWRTISHGRQWRGELRNRRKDGSDYWSLLSISPVRDSSGTITHFVSVSEDITDHKAHLQAIERLAFHDPLTGLNNRRYFLDQLDHQLRLNQRDGTLLGVLFLDLDHFKTINDTLGHDLGDELLKAMAEKILSCIRETDLAARLGGDEFTVLLPRLESGEGAERVAAALVEAVSEPIDLPGHRLEQSVSIGIALAEGTASLSPRQLLHRADQALYRAKEAGRNGYILFDGDDLTDDPTDRAEAD